MAQIKCVLLFLATFLILLGMHEAGASEQSGVAVQAWGGLCDSPGETESCFQSCRGTFDPDKDYAGYTMCLEQCKRRCQAAKEPWPLP